MQTVRALLKNNVVKFTDDLNFPIEKDQEYVVLVTFIGTNFNTALFGDYSLVDARKILAGIEVGLSKRELEILRLLQKGYTNIKIAKELELGDGTVRNYVSSIIEKLKAPNRTGAVTKAIELGLLE